ncbi:nucleoside phosphorylase domain-containing protein, partial [Aspergillus stella-maris]|uniref:nucleoside phosphorylase domain-containing protein n=1 Tax=Aspergillus stella-maris TaxID=1810926 RepID=UPI003CCDB42C
SRLFKSLQQRSCGKSHEIKLKVPEERSGSQEDPLDMFLSCCVDQTGWHQAQCGTFLAGLSKPRKDGICAAIQRAKMEGRSIYLSFDEQGLFDISDAMPAIASSSTRLTSETLKDLLDQKALTRISPSDYVAGTAIKKLSSRDKAIIALSLAKCLLEFFDEDMDLASHSWKPECIYFLGAPQAQQQDRALYISLRPSQQEVDKDESLSVVGLGNPILLSFAKLLLEIDTGERIAKEIQSESTANLDTWVWMCGFVDEVERNGGGNYLRAVEGCLYLHVGMRQSPGRPDDLKPGEFIREKIYEQIVRNLELVVNPQSSKRKRQDSVSEIPLSKKLSIIPSGPDTTILLTKMPSNNPNPRAALNNDYPTSRAAFEVAIVCALPLEFDAVCAIVDEFWNKDYGRATGDENFYTNARIGKLNVILLLLSNMGKASAASTCANLRSSYSGVRLVLMSGICGGVPISGEGEEILLGDVVISRHIVQYDLRRQYPGGFETRDTVEDRFGRAPKSVRNLLALLGTNMGRERLERLTATCLQDIQTKATKQYRGPKYQYPGALKDQLFEPTYHHPLHTTLFETRGTSICTASHKSSCKDIGCDTGQLVVRERIQSKRRLEQENRSNEAQAPSIFIGTIGSGDTVMKSGEERDRIARAHNLLAFEMEGAGVWDEMPCIIVKGVCDYADSHKNKDWQHFAAATAASATKGLLSCPICHVLSCSCWHHKMLL